MNRHVIKGRGENRGKYLCYARMAPEQTPTEDGFVWLSEQRKAARWEAPRYSGRTYATDLAAKFNGYFVKLVAPAAIKPVVRELRAFIASHAVGAKPPLPCHWFGADFDDAGFDDAGETFCQDCAEKFVDERYAEDPKRFEELYGECESDEERYAAAIDGWFDSQHDSPPNCDTCGAKLSGSLTEYGADQEIEALTDYAAPGFDDAEGWAALEDAVVNLSDDDPRWHKIAKVVSAARAAEREKKARQTSLAASPGMTEARTGLLGLLAARAVQKAPEPSYRLWDEFQRYLALPFERRFRPSKKIAKWERRLWNEAKVFLGLLGYEPRGDCFKAPYGTYHWPFVVEIEQYKLWQPPAFLEGRAYMLHPCPSGDPKWPHHRDANPYPQETEAHRQWDAGYISATADRSEAEQERKAA